MQFFVIIFGSICALWVLFACLDQVWTGFTYRFISSLMQSLNPRDCMAEYNENLTEDDIVAINDRINRVNEAHKKSQAGTAVVPYRRKIIKKKTRLPNLGKEWDTQASAGYCLLPGGEERPCRIKM